MSWYSTDAQTWANYYIDEFSLGDGACIAYALNPHYGQGGDLVPGWVYCLPGDPNDKTQFWRYAVEPMGLYQTVQGLFPPNGSVIADQTPLFQWNPESPGQYRLQVSTDELFSTTVIDEVVYAPEYQTTSKLANATYYWRIGTPDPNGSGWVWGATYNFVLQGGFTRISGHDIPEAIANGAAMAYEGDPWCWPLPSIIAVVGGGSTNFYKYNIAGNVWSPTDWLEDTHRPQYAGTSLTTNDPTEEYGQWPAAAFGGSTTSDHPWGYDTDLGQNGQWFEYPDDDFHSFPQPLGAGACFVDGPRPWSYLTTGEQGGNATDYFYAIEPKHIKHPHGGGPQSGDAHTGSIQARVIASYDGIEVEYQLPVAAHVRATLYDAVGRQVDMLDAGNQQPGTRRLNWNRGQEGRRLSAGAYFVMLDMGKEQVRLKSIIR